MSRIGTRTGRTHEEPMEPAPLVAPPVRLPVKEPVPLIPRRDDGEKLAA